RPDIPNGYIEAAQPRVDPLHPRHLTVRHSRYLLHHARTAVVVGDKRQLLHCEPRRVLPQPGVSAGTHGGRAQAVPSQQPLDPRARPAAGQRTARPSGAETRAATVGRIRVVQATRGPLPHLQKTVFVLRLAPPVRAVQAHRVQQVLQQSPHLDRQLATRPSRRRPRV
ncbi:hypothetical protein DYB26_008389, partial [Aphanomyces astaci]